MNSSPRKAVASGVYSILARARSRPSARIVPWSKARSAAGPCAWPDRRPEPPRGSRPAGPAPWDARWRRPVSPAVRVPRPGPTRPPPRRCRPAPRGGPGRRRGRRRRRRACAGRGRGGRRSRAVRGGRGRGRVPRRARSPRPVHGPRPRPGTRVRPGRIRRAVPRHLRTAGRRGAPAARAGVLDAASGRRRRRSRRWARRLAGRRRRGTRPHPAGPPSCATPRRLFSLRVFLASRRT